MRKTIAFWSASVAGLMWVNGAEAQTVLSNQYLEVTALTNATVELFGKSELHLTDSGIPLSGCTVDMNSVDSWVFLHEVKPSAVNAFLGRFKVSGANAVLDSNVKLVQHGQGTVVIPYPSDFEPLTIYDGENFNGRSMSLSPYTEYGADELGLLAGRASSFILKRGYTMTVAQNADGSGQSRNYVAADGDLEIGVLPTQYDNRINFIRIFPWRWTGKKGSCDVSPTSLDADWHYNWDISKSSTLDWEYAGIRQTRWWPGLAQDWASRGINHLSGYNEPGNSAEDAYESLNGGDVNLAVSTWSDLLATGLRVGAPAVTDGGRSWLYSFIDGCDAAGKRVDYVPIHFYGSFYNNDWPEGAADQLYEFLKAVHDEVQRPIWVTEFNNGANWTDDAYDPTTAQNKNVIEAMINMMDETPWIERYAIYSNVEWFRMTHYDDGSLTPMGSMYKAHKAPIGYVQALKKNRSRVASYYFEGDCRDDSGCGNNGMPVDVPAYTEGVHGQALELDGANSYVQLPGDIASSSAFSFSAWVYWNGGSAGQRIFDFGNYDRSQYLVLSPNQNGGLSVGLRNGGSTSWVSASTALPSGSWQHVAVTVSSSTARLYVNGVQQASGSFSASALSGTLYNYLGKSQWSTDPLFSGKLDDVHIANYAMSQSDIAAMMDNTMQMTLSTNAVGLSGEHNVPVSGSVAGTATDPDDASIAYYKIYGPDWLALNTDGTFSGTPGTDVEGPQIFTVRAVDNAGERRYFMLTVELPYLFGDGTWIADADGLWSDQGKWSDALPANGAGYTADFSRMNISADRTVTVDDAHYLESLLFGDTTGGQSWTLAGTGTLTLDSGDDDTPVIDVENTAALEVMLAGTDGLTKSGSGTLILAGSNTLSGTVRIDTGATSGSDGAVCLAHPAALAHADSLHIRNTSSGSSTLQLDGSLRGGVTVPGAIELYGRTASVPAIQNLSGTNVLSGGITTQAGGTLYIVQSDAGSLELGGLISSEATGYSRTWTFKGAGDIMVSGIIETGTASQVNVVKGGSGALVLNGINTYNGLTMVYGGELVLNGSTGRGDTSVASGAVLSGAGTVRADLTVQSGGTVRVGGQGFVLGPDTGFALVDDFESAVSGADGASLTPPWLPGFPAGGAGSAITEVGADAGTRQALHYTHGGSGGQINYASVGTIAAEGKTGTIFFQADFSVTGSDTLFAFGRSGASAYSDFASLFRVPSDLIVEVHDGGYTDTSTSVLTDTLYNFWVVIDNDANTSSLYCSTGTNAPALIASGYAFRSTTADDIDTVYIGTNSGSEGFIDNIYIDPASANLTNPLEVTALVPKASTLRVGGDLTLESGASLVLDASSTNLLDQLAVDGTLTLGGTLVIESPTNLLVSGDAITLFDAGAVAGSFEDLQLPELELGLAWDTAGMSNGVLSIYRVTSVDPVNVAIAVSSNGISLSWPADHTGWRVEYNYESLTNEAAWMSLSGSETNNLLNLDLPPSFVDTMFFRLVYP